MTIERKTQVIETKITKVYYDDEFSHWECDVYLNGENFGGGTAPSFYGVSDMASEMVSDYIMNTLDQPDWFEDDYNKIHALENVTLENSDVKINVHNKLLCKNEVCSIHNRSNHSMRSFPQSWRADRRIMERICSHGVGHPDPDEYRIINRQDDGTHGCDGCCGKSLCDTCKKPATYRLYHRDLSETLICDSCEKPLSVRSISKVGLEFKNDYKYNVKVEE